MTWRSRRVLVTGADGFIGSHLTEALVREGADVRAFCYYNSTGSKGWLEDVEPAVLANAEVRFGDVRDQRLVADACEDIEVVFHLAALIAIPYSYAAPESFVETNVRGTLNVLEGVRRAGCDRLVHTSTSEVYGTPDTVPITESHPLRGQSPYSASKIAADKLCEAFACSFETPVVILRPFNTYGPRQTARAIIPTILGQLLSGSREVELGSLTPKRDLTFVSDTVRGFLSAGEAEGVLGQTIQLGTNRAESVEDIFRIACRVCGLEATVVQRAERMRPRGSEVMVLQSNPSLADRLLGWRPHVSLEEGLERTAEWMGRHLSRFSTETYAI